MQKFIKKRSRKAGLVPGSLVYIGEEGKSEANIRFFEYDEIKVLEKEFKRPEECLEYKYKKPTVTWIDVEGIRDIKTVEKIGLNYNIHPLALEDILNTDQRPKIEDFASNVFIVLKMLTYNDKKKEIVSEQVSLVLGTSYVISFQEGIEGDVFNPIRERIRNDKGKIRKEGADYLLYSLIDTIVDNYFLILEKLADEIERLEKELLSNPTLKSLKRLHDLKREMIFLRKSIWPSREVAVSLQRDESPLIKHTTRIFFRDVYDHVVQVMESIEIYRDMLASMVEIYVSNLSNKTNTVMKLLTIIATIFMPPTFIVGVYGMNFHHMPELSWKWGYPLVMLFIIITMLLMFVYFRKKKWM